MSWIEIQLLLNEKYVDEISGYLFAMGCEGLYVRENKIIVYLFAMGCEGLYVRENKIIVYFNLNRWSAENEQAIIQYIRFFVPAFSAKNLKILSRAEQDWNTKWKQHFTPLKLGRQLVIIPPWETYRPQGGEQVVTINPQMGFGTGHHESTQLAVFFLQKYLKTGQQVLDLGTGSGILAIIAEKLGAGEIVALDIDPAAVQNAEENMFLNKSKNIQLHIAGLEQLADLEFDLLVANLNKNIVLRYANSFSKFMKSGAKLILSGILVADAYQILKTYRENGFNLVDQHSSKEWLSLVFELGLEKKHEKSSR